MFNSDSSPLEMPMCKPTITEPDGNDGRSGLGPWTFRVGSVNSFGEPKLIYELLPLLTANQWTWLNQLPFFPSGLWVPNLISLL